MTSLQAKALADATIKHRKEQEMRAHEGIVKHILTEIEKQANKGYYLLQYDGENTPTMEKALKVLEETWGYKIVPINYHVRQIHWGDSC